MSRRRLPPVLATALGIAMLALAGCPAPKSPTGPPPEYEDPPPPSWMEAGAPPALEAGAPAALVN